MTLVNKGLWELWKTGLSFSKPLWARSSASTTAADSTGQSAPALTKVTDDIGRFDDESR